MLQVITRSLITGAYLVIAAVVALLLTSVVFGKLVSVQSNSMQPTFKAGDAILLSIDTSRLLRGDIITYRDARNPSQTISHRITHISGGTFLTAGDAQRDQIAKVSRADIIGKTVMIAPGFGHVMDFMRSWTGMILFVYMPAAMIITNEIWNLSRRMHQPIYMLLPSTR